MYIRKAVPLSYTHQFFAGKLVFLILQTNQNTIHDPLYFFLIVKSNPQLFPIISPLHTSHLHRHLRLVIRPQFPPERLGQHGLLHGVNAVNDSEGDVMGLLLLGQEAVEDADDLALFGERRNRNC